MSRRLALVLAGVMLLALPALAIEDRPFPEYTGPEFQALYDYAIENTLPNLGSINGRYSVTGNESLDDRIWAIAFERGYVVRPSAGEDLVRYDGILMQAGAAEAWAALRPEARRAGMGFIVSSAYRSPESQRHQFNSKLEGTSDSAINRALDWYSLPGTSKHHAGYALDFRYADGTFGEFRRTRDYAWLKADNFAVPKKHGLIPSYPDDGVAQGPRPEPWEFVWVGVDLVQCGLPQDLSDVVEGPAAALVAEIEKCPGGPAPAVVPDWLAS